MKTFKLAKTAVAALALCAGAAQAVPSPSVIEWNVVDIAVFNPTSVVPNNGVAPFPVLSTNPGNGPNTLLSWGTGFFVPSQQSSIALDNQGSPYQVFTGIPANTVEVTHNNFPINPGSSLTEVQIIGILTLQSVDPLPAGPVVGPVQLPFIINFLETPNAGGAGGVCAGGGISGVGPLNGAGCADIFVIDVASLNFPFFYDSDGAGGGDPVEYFLSIGANGFDPLPNAACTAVLGAGNNGCRGFMTAENQATTAIFNLLITEVPFGVPEPGSLALMGLGMASLGWIGRRRKQQQG